MVEIKDTGSEFHWSRPRIVGLIFAAAASPIYLAFTAFGHATVGGVIWLVTCIGLMIAYVRPTRFRSLIQRMIPTTVATDERSHEP